MTRTPILFGIMLVLGASAMAPSVLAADAWGEARRDVSFQSDAAGVRFQSALKEGSVDDLVTGAYGFADHRFMLGYLDRTRPNATPVHVYVTFDGLVEFLDADGDGAYTFGDSLAQRTNLSDLGVPRVDITPYGEGGRVVSLTYILPGTSGAQLVLRFWVLDRPDTIEGETRGPLQVQWEVRVEGFRFHSNASRVAVETRVAADPLPRQSDGEILTGGDGPGAYYRWPSDGEVDGSVRPLRVSLIAAPAQGRADPGSLVFHAFDQGDHASYRPLIGVGEPSDGSANPWQRLLSSGNASAYMGGLAVAALLVGLGVWRRSRQP